jgi:hypothetical protein
VGGSYLAEILNREEVLAILPYTESEAMSLIEIAAALGMDTSTYAGRIRASHNLARVLRIQIKRGWVACTRRQRENGHKFWHNAYWRVEAEI